MANLTLNHSFQVLSMTCITSGERPNRPARIAFPPLSLVHQIGGKAQIVYETREVNKLITLTILIWSYFMGKLLTWMTQHNLIDIDQEDILPQFEYPSPSRNLFEQEIFNLRKILRLAMQEICFCLDSLAWVFWISRNISLACLTAWPV